MTDYNEDIDDFDIYADLDDNIDLNFNDSDNCFDKYKNFSEPDLPSILTKTPETLEQNNENITETDGNPDFEIENSQIKAQNEEQTQNVSNNTTIGESTNDMILSEITILDKCLKNTEDNNKTLVKQNQELRQQLNEKERHLTVLKTNISSLYKTAKAEIERKKQEINGLREELDSIIFRRLPRNGISVDNSQQSVNKTLCQTNDQSSQTLDRDFRNTQKKSPDSSVRSPKERPISDRKTRRSRSKSNQRSHRRSRSRSVRRNRSSPPKSSQKSRKSRSKSPQRARRSRSKSNQRNRRERLRTPNKDRDRTNSEKKSKTSPKAKHEENKRKTDKSDAKPITDTKRQK